MTDSRFTKASGGFGEDSKVVKFDQRDVEGATRLLSLIADNDSAVDLRPLQIRATQVLADRRRRQVIFGRGMFGEHAWEILLLLYIAEAGPRPSINRLAHLTRASKSTALRWIDYLDGQLLVHRESHPRDKRAAFVELTEKGKKAIELYLSATIVSDR